MQTGRIRYRRSLAAAVVAGLIMAACGSGSGDESTIDDGIVPPPPQVDGTSWQFVAGGRPTGDIALVDGYPITVTFEDGQVSGTAGCNTYSGSFRLDGYEFSVNALTQTEIGCEPAVMAVEAAYLAALQDATELTISGDQLAIGRTDIELIFDPQ